MSIGFIVLCPANDRQLYGGRRLIWQMIHIDIGTECSSIVSHAFVSLVSHLLDILARHLSDIVSI